MDTETDVKIRIIDGKYCIPIPEEDIKELDLHEGDEVLIDLASLKKVKKYGIITVEESVKKM